VRVHVDDAARHPDPLRGHARSPALEARTPPGSHAAGTHAAVAHARRPGRPVAVIVMNALLSCLAGPLARDAV